MEHSAVMEVAVVGHNDEKGLTKPKAFVVLKEGKKGTAELEKEIKQWVLDRMAQRMRLQDAGARPQFRQARRARGRSG